ncbi:hypothetical protein A6A04_05320 [Paramagnetospirillum marisnigri]|uniref:Uncharacterized protein n=1 Tax=Paramagnetospirillum marisnigri TaxID=1285242 RepID=A0A178MHI3_9PROT|nr:hypothetical protein [Paramagnetospirillum marisnigri]OAN48172.1 hypothetical protein A6A04_05320 [Paramagnetospirillum marisnigri]
MVQSLIAALREEKKRLDAQLDEALHTFAEYEEGMNIRWQTADPAARQELMAERSRVEEELGIVALVLRLDEIREELEAAEASRVA